MGRKNKNKNRRRKKKATTTAAAAASSAAGPTATADGVTEAAADDTGDTGTMEDQSEVMESEVTTEMEMEERAAPQSASADTSASASPSDTADTTGQQRQHEGEPMLIDETVDSGTCTGGGGGVGGGDDGGQDQEEAPGSAAAAAAALLPLRPAAGRVRNDATAEAAALLDAASTHSEGGKESMKERRSPKEKKKRKSNSAIMQQQKQQQQQQQQPQPKKTPAKVAKSKAKGKKAAMPPPTPPPPSIPPPPAPPTGPPTAPPAVPPAGPAASNRTPSKAKVTVVTPLKSSAVIEPSGIFGAGLCLASDGNLGSRAPPINSALKSGSSAALVAHESDLTTPEKMERIDLKEVERRLLGGGGDGNGGGGNGSPNRHHKKREYEDELEGYGLPHRSKKAAATEEGGQLLAKQKEQREREQTSRKKKVPTAFPSIPPPPPPPGKSAEQDGVPAAASKAVPVPMQEISKPKSTNIGVYVPSGPPKRRNIGATNTNTSDANIGVGGSASGVSSGMAAKIQSLNEKKVTAAAQSRAAELTNLRRKGIAKIFNKHFTTEAESIAKEREAADRALAELERQKEELANKHRAYKDKSKESSSSDRGGIGELSQLEAMHAEIQRRRNEVRQKEQETKELYRRYVCQFGPDAATAAGAPAIMAKKAKDAEDTASSDKPGTSRGGGGKEVAFASTPTSAAAANNAAAEFFRNVNTGANAGLPLIGPGRTAAAESAAASKSSKGSFGSDHNYQGTIGGTVVAPTATSSSKSSLRASFGSDNYYEGQRGGMVVKPASPLRYKSSAKRVLPAVGEDLEDFDMADLQNENVVRQADLLMARMMEKSQRHDAEVVPKKQKIDEAVTKFKQDGKEIVTPVGRDYITPSHGSRHAVSAVGTNGQEILLSRSGGVINKNHNGDIDVKDSDVNWQSYRERDLVPLNPEEMVGEFSKPIQEPELITPRGAVWKRPDAEVTAAQATPSTPSTAELSTSPASAPFASRPEDIKGREGQVSDLIASLDAGLRGNLDIDPSKTCFTLKMTGGPDDRAVAGDIKALLSKYGDNIQIVGLADHSGCAEDPAGLSHDELLRLVEGKMSISNFNESKLSGEGVVYQANTDEGIRARDSMHNRLESDVFVSAGGASDTFDSHNYKKFCKADGTPSSSLIIERSNSFMTAEARQKLQEEAGVVVISEDIRSTKVKPSSHRKSSSIEDPATTSTSKPPGEVLPRSNDEATALIDAPYNQLNLDINSDSVSSLGSLGDLTQDDITVATTTLYNFLRQETENIRKMFEESERAEREAFEGVSNSSDAASLTGTVNTRHSEASKESEAARVAELMARKMADATKWIESTRSEDGEDDEEEGETEDEEDGAGGDRLYSIHQTGDMLEFGIDSTIKSVRWDAYWSSEYAREYYHEPLTNTTTWTKPNGVRVDPKNANRNPSATPTEDTTVLSEETVEVKDYTTSSSGGGGVGKTPTSIQRARSPGTVVSEVTYDDGNASPQPRRIGWLWSPKARSAKSSTGTRSTAGARSEATEAALRSADEFRPDAGISGRSSQSLVEYRRRQRRRRKKRRRRAAAFFFVFLLLVALTMHWKGAVIVPALNQLSGGRLADALLPFIDTDTALKYHLTRLPRNQARDEKVGDGENKPKLASREKKKKAKVTIETGTATRASTGASAGRKPSDLLAEFRTNIATSLSTGDKTTSKKMGDMKSDKKKSSTEVGKKAGGVAMKASPRKKTATDMESRKAAAAEKEKRIRRMICNIPFAYIFIRQCWRESRELPFEIDSLLDSMAQ